MSRKNTDKKSKNQKKQNIAVIITVVILSIVLVWLILLAAGLELNLAAPIPPADDPAVTTVPQPEQTTSAPEVTAPAEEEVLFDLGGGVKVVGLVSYTGAFMEDRTDEVVADVLAMKVVNTGKQYIQTMDITLTAGDTEAKFSLSSLFPGESVIVLEKDRMAYSTAPAFEQARTSAVALFDSYPGMCQDKIEVQCLEGVINVTNISGEDITGDILIYYKNYVDGDYYGGITYRVRIQGGLKAGQIYQGTAAHFNPDNSRIVFVTCG